jgi:hypothetical protein
MGEKAVGSCWSADGRHAPLLVRLSVRVVVQAHAVGAIPWWHVCPERVVAQQRTLVSSLRQSRWLSHMSSVIRVATGLIVLVSFAFATRASSALARSAAGKLRTYRPRFWQIKLCGVWCGAAFSAFLLLGSFFSLLHQRHLVLVSLISGFACLAFFFLSGIFWIARSK